MGVLGIGGLFFRARDPDALATWYCEHLGVGAGCVGEGGGDADPHLWRTAAGATVFAPFPADSDYFATDRAYMLNFRVNGLDAMLATLRAAGVETITKAEWDAAGMGRFARLHDPEGNPVELWEPSS